MQLNINWLAKELRIEPMDEDAQAAIETAFRFEFVGANIPIVHQGTSVHDLYILRSGSLRITHHKSGRSVTLGQASKNRTFGEISFFGGEPATANVIADQPCEIYKISRENFEWLMHRHSDIAMKLMAYVLRGMGEVIRGIDKTKH